jgi:hypothetical protein
MRYCDRIRSLSISQSVSERCIESAGKPGAGLLQLLLHNGLIRIKIGRINSSTRPGNSVRTRYRLFSPKIVGHGRILY